MHKTIFSLRVKTELAKKNMMPVLEKDNINKLGFKCWVYELTPEFEDALREVFKALESEANGT